MSRRFAAALLCASFLSAPAWAALPTPTEGWHTGAVPTPNGEFSYCVTEAKYSNGLWLIVALNPERGINLGMGLPGARMTVGAESMIPVQFEGAPPQQVKARATKPELIVISAGNTPELLVALAQANSITIDGNAFALTGSGRAMAELRQCVANRGVSPAQTAAQPVVPPPTATSPAQSTMARFQSGSSAPAAPMAAAPDLSEPVPPTAMTPPGTRGAAPSPFAPAQISAAAAAPPVSVPVAAPPEPAPVVEAPVSPPVAPTPVAAAPVIQTVKPLPGPLATLLAKAGLRDVTPLTEPGSAFAWSSRDLTGRVVEVSVPPGSSIEQVAGNHLAALTDKCQGTLTPEIGTPETAGAMTLLTADTFCRGEGVRSYTTYVYALSAQGVLSVISHTLDGGHRALADKAQAGLVKALKGE